VLPALHPLSPLFPPAEVIIHQDPVLKGDDLAGALGAQDHLSE
jgi:hypothetical protein